MEFKKAGTMNNTLLEVIKIRNFQKIWGTQLLSQITLNMLNFILIIKIFEKTHSTMSISLVWVFYAIPAVLLGPFSGSLVDIFSRKKVLIGTSLINGIVVLFYLLVRNNIYPIYAIIFLYSTINQLYMPAEAATLPAVVSKKLLPAANTVFLFTIYGSFLLGFGLSGPFLKILGNQGPFILSWMLLSLGALIASRLPSDIGARKLKFDYLIIIRKFKEGYKFIRDHPTVQAPLVVLVAAQMIISLFTVIFPSYAVDVLGINLRDAGPVVIIPLGFGAVIGASIINRLILHKRKRKLISYGAFMVGISLVIMAVFAVFLRQAGWLVLLLAFILGAGAVSILIPSQTFLQEQTPENFRARVFGALGFLITLAAMPPVLFAGAVADLIGVTIIFSIVAVMTIVFAVFMKGSKNVIF